MDPFFGFPVKKCVTFVAAFLFLSYMWNLTQSVFLVIAGAMTIGKSECPSLESDTIREEGESLLVWGIILLLFALLGLYFSIILWQAAAENDPEKCCHWMISAVIILAFNFLYVLTNLINGNHVSMLYDVMDVIFSSWSIEVVNTFWEKLLAQQNQFQFSNPFNSNDQFTYRHIYIHRSQVVNYTISQGLLPRGN
ncbi:hypothetical protein Fcan01_09953 [Folsomia candida]|uniref:Uncharacterized protein n=1 Tax=Folsomia candida TaxID=158441 RepID=A0A226EDX3_FOLCA|nr:hypothetical protein Fcan01_09953 [Folsomia candida]